MTPADRSWSPQAEAMDVSARGVTDPWSRADGISEIPGPVSAWTSPPSWLAATKNRTSSVADFEVRACTAPATCRAPVIPPLLSAPKITEPK